MATKHPTTVNWSALAAFVLAITLGSAPIAASLFIAAELAGKAVL